MCIIEVYILLLKRRYIIYIYIISRYHIASYRDFGIFSIELVLYFNVKTKEQK